MEKKLNHISPTKYIFYKILFMAKEDFMREAIHLSTESVKNGGGPFGVVIVRNNRIIAYGTNRVVPNNDPTAHAEVCAIRQACKVLGTVHLSGCEIYSSCEPCPMCLSAIYWAKIDRLYFANTKKDAAAINFADDFIYKELKLPIKERTLPTFTMMRKEALQAFYDWKENPNKIEY